MSLFFIFPFSDTLRPGRIFFRGFPLLIFSFLFAKIALSFLPGRKVNTMIRKTEKLVITFHTTTAAMAMEHLCREQNADGRIIPVPGSISADCGLAWCAKNESEDALLALMVQHGIIPQGIHHCLI